LKDARLHELTAAGRATLAASGLPGAPDATALLKIALANEISVSELAAAWMPRTPEVDVKIALARQAGDEARHFGLVEGRLRDLGFDSGSFAAPPSNALFDYLRELPTSVERVAGGLFTLEAIAYAVNEEFMRACGLRGDQETVRLYREYIQPDEREHQRLGRALLEKYATTPEVQEKARQAVRRTLEIAGGLRARAAERLGTACFPGC
jgi:uncharacterized ferritin-like protein (DUF455 family)